MSMGHLRTKGAGSAFRVIFAVFFVVVMLSSSSAFDPDEGMGCRRAPPTAAAANLLGGFPRLRHETVSRQ